MSAGKIHVTMTVRFPREGVHEKAIEGVGRGVHWFRTMAGSHVTLKIDCETDGGPTMADLRAALGEITPTDSGT